MSKNSQLITYNTFIEWLNSLNFKRKYKKKKQEKDE